METLISLLIGLPSSAVTIFGYYAFGNDIGLLPPIPIVEDTVNSLVAML